jgi:hypothetical protein
MGRLGSVLVLGVLLTLGWLYLGSQQTVAPAARAVVPSTEATGKSVTSNASADQGVALQARRSPVPLVRNSPALPAGETLPDAPAPDPEAQVQDELDKRAAQAAIEADGYKRVSVLGKGADGSWRAKAHRGSTEVQLTVDGTGRVTLE